MKVGDLVRWEQEGQPEDNDMGIIMGFSGDFELVEVYWFREADEYRYQQAHPCLEVVSESR